MNRQVSQLISGLYSHHLPDRDRAAVALKWLAHRVIYGEISAVGFRQTESLDGEWIAEQFAQQNDFDISVEQLAQQMLELSHTSNDFVSAIAKEVLGEIGPLPAAIMSELLTALKSGDRDTRYWAASTLNELRQGVTPAAKELGEALNDPEHSVRGQAASALRHLGTDAAPALYSLIAALAHEDSTIRSSMASLLETLGETAEPALEPLIRALKDNEQIVRLNAARALGALKAKAAFALPALEAAGDVAPLELRRSYTDSIERIQFHLLP